MLNESETPVLQYSVRGESFRALRTLVTIISIIFILELTVAKCAFIKVYIIAEFIFDTPPLCLLFVRAR